MIRFVYLTELLSVWQNYSIFFLEGDEKWQNQRELNMKLKFKQRSIWKNLALALAGTPMIAFIGLLVIGLVGALDDAITKIQLQGQWWILLIIAYIISLAYFFYEPKFRRNRERKKFVSALILYWEAQLAQQNKPQPSEEDIKIMSELLLKRVKIWAWFNPKMWAECYPYEKYSENPFEILDVLIACHEDKLWGGTKKKHEKGKKEC